MIIYYFHLPSDKKRLIRKSRGIAPTSEIARCLSWKENSRTLWWWATTGCFATKHYFVPDVLLLDEVTTGLDEESKQIVNQLLNQLNKEQGVTLVRVTHDTEEIQQAQQVIRIVAGKVAPTDGFSS